MRAVKSTDMASHGLVHSRIDDNFIVVYERDNYVPPPAAQRQLS